MPANSHGSWPISNFIWVAHSLQWVVERKKVLLVLFVCIVMELAFSAVLRSVGSAVTFSLTCQVSLSLRIRALLESDGARSFELSSPFSVLYLK